MDTQPADPNFAARLRRTFERQKVMATFGAVLTHVGADFVEIVLPCRDELTQQHGFLHAGVVSTVLDTACGLAALWHMPAGAAVLAIEYKVNFLAPAQGEQVIARGHVVKVGRTISVCQGDAYAVSAGGDEKHVAALTSTMMVVRGRGLID